MARTARLSPPPTPRNPWFLVCRSLHGQAAIDIYTQALGMCPDHDDGLVARGAAFATTGRLRQAVQDLSQALNLNPQNDNAARYLKETRRCDQQQCTAFELSSLVRGTVHSVHVGCRGLFLTPLAVCFSRHRSIPLLLVVFSFSRSPKTQGRTLRCMCGAFTKFAGMYFFLPQSYVFIIGDI